MSKSFLVLFFKKEHLPAYTRRRPDDQQPGHPVTIDEGSGAGQPVPTALDFHAAVAE